jgi:hypothetical protein
MPELDSFDLEAAFASLQRDVAERSRPGGADRAVSTARRRRRTTVGAVTAVALLAMGGVAIGSGLGHDDAVTPAHQLPTSAPFDGAHLSAATRGWTPAWGPETDASRLRLSQTFGGTCLFVPPHGHGGITALTNSHVDVAVATVSDYGSQPVHEAPDWRREVRKVAHCDGAELVGSFSGPAGVVGRTYRITQRSQSTPAYLWMVRTARGIGVLKIFGQSEPLPTDRDRPVADVLLAAVLDHSNDVVSAQHEPVSTGHASRIDPTKTLGQVWAEELQPALAGWETPWNPHLGGVPGPEMPPCAAGFDDAAPGPAESVNVGSDGGEWVKWFDDEPAAVAAVDQLQQALTTCSTPYTFHSVTLSDGRAVLVGVGPRVVWIERVASHVLLVHLPPGSAPPSDDTSLKVGAVLEHVLEQPATTTMSPDGHTTVPEWMQREIAAAPTFGP